MRPLTERRRKHSPLKDVAGMLRSFNYAAWATMFKTLNTLPGTLTGLAPWVENWEQGAAAALMDGYRSAIGDSPTWPVDPKDARALIDLFTLEKAFYEIRYELSHRPAWVRIPLTGGLKLLRL